MTLLWSFLIMASFVGVLLLLFAMLVAALGRRR